MAFRIRYSYGLIYQIARHAYVQSDLILRSHVTLSTEDVQYLKGEAEKLYSHLPLAGKGEEQQPEEATAVAAPSSTSVAPATGEEEKELRRRDDQIYFDEFVQLLAKRERPVPGEKTDPKVCLPAYLSAFYLPIYLPTYLPTYLHTLLTYVLLRIDYRSLSFYVCWSSIGPSVKMRAITWRPKEPIGS